jgi:nucleoid DNA-binding protein
MTKVNIAEYLYVRMGGITKAQAAEYVDLIFASLKDVLAGGENLQISGFGKFAVKNKKERVGRNPHTGDKLVLPARRVVRFTPGNVLRKTMNSQHA